MYKIYGNERDKWKLKTVTNAIARFVYLFVMIRSSWYWLMPKRMLQLYTDKINYYEYNSNKTKVKREHIMITKFEKFILCAPQNFWFCFFFLCSFGLFFLYSKVAVSIVTNIIVTTKIVCVRMIPCINNIWQWSNGIESPPR